MSGDAVYLRVSSEEQRERQSIETQRAEALRYCGAHSIASPTVYADDGVSGTIPFERRPVRERQVRVSRQHRQVGRRVRQRVEPVEPIRPSTNEDEMGSPWFDGLDESSESGKVVHLCPSFNDVSQYLSMNQFGLLFATRWMDGDIEPNLKDIRNCQTI